MAVDCIHPRRSDDLPCLAGPAGARRMVLLLSLLITACAGSGKAMDQQARYGATDQQARYGATDQQARYGATDQQARYGAMVGRSEADLTRSFGLPTRRENIEGHAFLIYEQSDVWSGNGGGTRSRPAGRSGAVAFECRATFVVVAGVIRAYSLSGSGC
jgi:hypothetical protein